MGRVWELVRRFLANALLALDVRNQPTVSPLKADLDQLKGLPPALIINGQCDVPRDEEEAYARKLIQAGVPVTATVT